MMFLWILFFAVIFFGFWSYSNRSTKGLPWGAEKTDALDILQKRFAQGEIDDKEYEERKAVLEDEL